jgi:Uma2 family endonuclease
MAAPNSPLVPVEEYLNTSYEHDVEYVDGVLVERSMPAYRHGLLQGLVFNRLFARSKEYRYGVSVETRVELVERSRYRIPDVLICPLPINLSDKALKSVPLAVIEIWSPDDRLSHQMLRFRDYWNRGVRHIIVLEPEELIAFQYRDGALIEGHIESIDLDEYRRVPFRTAELFNDFRDELNHLQNPSQT